MHNSIKSNNHSSYLYLLLGFVALFFSNGKWILPVATYLSPIFLIRFLRYRKPGNGFLHLIIAGLISNIFIWKGMIPTSGMFYYILMLMMSIFASLTYLIDRIYYRRIPGIVSTLVFPSVFVLMEFITISTNPSGTFGMLGHTQSSLPLLQILSVTGIYGITFIVMWTASVINWLWDHGFENHNLQKTLWVYAVPVLVITLYGQIRVGRQTNDDTVRIASISIPEDELIQIYEGQPDSINSQLKKSFLNSCHIAAMSGAKIVFGTEGLVNVHSDMENCVLEQAQELAIRDSIYLGLPMLVFFSDASQSLPMNKITWISPEGELLFEYCKTKPTPGEGEYGDGVIHSFDSPYGRIGSAICFDMDFPSLIHQASSMQIDIMAVPGNDWREISPYHTYVASFRAIEQGFSMVRAASWGLSASFNGRGKKLSSLDYYTSDQSILYSDVPTKRQVTVYSIIGDLFAWIVVLFVLAISMYVIVTWKAQKISSLTTE